MRRARYWRRRRVLRRQRRASRPHQRVLPRGLRRQVSTTHGVLRPRARRDRRCARVAARLPHPSGNKPREPYARVTLGQRPLQKDWALILLPPPLPRSVAAHTSALITFNSRATHARKHLPALWASVATWVYITSSVLAAFIVNSEPHTGARPSVRLCVGPELAGCVH